MKKDEASPDRVAKNLSGMIAVGGIWLGGSRAIRAFSSLLAVIVLARLLSPPDFGVIAFVTSSTVLSLLMLEGLIDYPLSSSIELRTETIQSALWLGLGCMSAMSLVILVVAPNIEKAVKFPHLATSLIATVPVYISQVFSVAGAALLKRQKRFADIATASFISALTYLLVAVCLAFIGCGLWSIVVAQLLSSALAAIVMVRASGMALAIPRQWAMAPIASTSVNGLVARVLAWVWTNADTFAVGVNLGAAATGLYSRGYNLCVQLKEPFQALNEPLRQAFVAIYERQGQLATSVIQGLRIATLLSALIASACVAFRDLIVLLLLGSQWQSVAPILAILAMGLPARVALNMLENMDLSVGRLKATVIRHLFLVLVVGTGVFIVAPSGLIAVASLVTGALYVALLLPRMGAHRLVKSSQLLAAMMPGLAVAILLAVISEYVLKPVLSSQMAEVGAIGVLYVLAVLAISIFLPKAWLPFSVQEKRKRIMAKMMK